MFKSKHQSHLPFSTAASANSDTENLMNINTDHRRSSALNDKRINNVNYVRHVLRRFFGSYHKRTSTSSSTFDDISSEQLLTTNIIRNNSISSIVIHPCLEYDKHTKFSGKLEKPPKILI